MIFSCLDSEFKRNIVFFKKVLSPENLTSGRNNKIKIQYKCNPAQGFQMVLCSTLGAQAAYTPRRYEGDLTVKSTTGLAGWMKNSKLTVAPSPPTLGLTGMCFHKLPLASFYQFQKPTLITLQGSFYGFCTVMVAMGKQSSSPLFTITLTPSDYSRAFSLPHHPGRPEMPLHVWAPGWIHGQCRGSC